jgi:predicted signal transduction protein with EAL and GGDEF domain
MARSLGLITASIGVAALPDHGTNEKDLLQAADAALYRAKLEGRDRVMVAEGSDRRRCPGKFARYYRFKNLKGSLGVDVSTPVERAR